MRRFVAENTPVILEGALPESCRQALSWTPDSLAAHAPPGTLVRVAPLMSDGRDKWIEDSALWPGAEGLDAPPGVVHTDRVLAVAAARIEVTAEDFAASLRGEGSLPALYADGASNLEHSFSFLAHDVSSPPAVGSLLNFRKTDLWLGGRTLSTLHFDNYENLFAQLVGEKEFVLCPPGDSCHLIDGRLRKAYATWDPSGFARTAAGLSEETVINYAAYNIESPPPEYADRASKLRRTVVRVRPGEVLYLPFGWWHQVRAAPAANGLCASAASFFDPFFVRLQPKALARLGRLVPNPKYRATCERLGLGDSSDDEAPSGPSRAAAPSGARPG